ncbi:uncharacterized protein LOC133723129 [Rosa rugosa]|uniref:uncharacterized protein LOC133723129 n=1 Tax=Rosa rugosa TaxID=74645 RepID=UPI002B40AE40|nr:uncharacterized protein LOC133723129 [Rosa rugosa]
MEDPNITADTISQVLLISWSIWHSKNQVSKYFHIKWNPPNHDQIKINFDGSERQGIASLGFDFRNANGQPIFAASKNLGPASILIAAATALRDALHAAQHYNFSRVLVEGDSKVLMDCILKKIGTPWRIKTLVEDIWKIASSFSFIRYF